MIKDNHFRQAGDIIRSAVKSSGESGEENIWKDVSFAMALRRVTEQWGAVAGTALAMRSKLVSVEPLPDEKSGRLKFTVNVRDASILTAAQFRKQGIESRLSALFRRVCVVEFKVGSIKEAAVENISAPYKYRRKIVLKESDVEAEAAKFEAAGASHELALAIARLKLTVEKR